MRILISIMVLLLLVSRCFAPPIDKTRPLNEQVPNQHPSAQPLTVKEAEAAMLKLTEEWSRKSQFDSDYDKQGALDQDFYGLLTDIAGDAVRFESEALTEALVAFPAHTPGVVMAKAHAFRIFQNAVEPAIPFLVNCLSHPDADIQKEASAALVVWGREWEKAIQTMYNNNNYLVLGGSKDPRAADACRFGAQNGSFEGRILAAWALQAFGDTTTLIEVSKYVLANAPVNDPLDNSIARAKYTAIRTLVRHHQFDDIAALSRLASDSAALVRIETVDALAFAASQGNVAAYEALRIIADSNPDEKLRGTARLYLQRLEETQEERK